VATTGGLHKLRTRFFIHFVSIGVNRAFEWSRLSRSCGSGPSSLLVAVFCRYRPTSPRSMSHNQSYTRTQCSHTMSTDPHFDTDVFIIRMTFLILQPSNGDSDNWTSMILNSALFFTSYNNQQ